MKDQEKRKRPFGGGDGSLRENYPILLNHANRILNCFRFAYPAEAFWRLGGLEAWRHRGSEAWRLGGLEAWRRGSLEGWRLGGLEASKFEGLKAWRLGDLETNVQYVIILGEFGELWGWIFIDFSKHTSDFSKYTSRAGRQD